MLNMITIQGRLTGDLQLQTASTGNQFLSFSIANETGFGANKKTAFLRCSAFGKTAENLAKFFGKGDGVIVTGQLTVDEYTDRQGAQRREAKILVRDFDFPLSRRDRDGAPVPEQRAPQPGDTAPIAEPEIDLPF